MSIAVVQPGPAVQEAAADGPPRVARPPHHEDPARRQGHRGAHGGARGEGRHRQSPRDEGGIAQ